MYMYDFVDVHDTILLMYVMYMTFSYGFLFIVMIQ